MIPRLRVVHRQLGWAVWPDNSTGKRSDCLLFENRPAYQKCVVIVDSDVLVPDLVVPQRSDEISTNHILTSVLRSPYIIKHLYADEGPPDQTETMHDEFFGKVTPGWIVTCGSQNETTSVIHFTESGPVLTGVTDRWIGQMVEADRSLVYGDPTAQEARIRKARDLLAREVANVVEGDLFITDRPYLHEATPFARGRTAKTLVVSSQDALAFLSMYLRSQEDFTVWYRGDGQGRYSFDRGMFYWVAARVVLHAAWRWYSACVEYDRVSGTGELGMLGGSVLWRMDRCLRSRDEVHRTLSRRPGNNSADDNAAALDAFLLFLMSAVDATAKVAHRVLGLSKDIFFASWLRKEWIRNLSTVAPELYSLVAEGTDGHAALLILSRLRNSVHGEFLSPVVFMEDQANKIVVRLPRSSRQDILDAVDQLGGRGYWGIKNVMADEAHVDAGVLVERLLPRVAGLLNAIMDATPVDTLSGVELSACTVSPPSGGPFEARIRRIVRGQLGLETPSIKNYRCD